MRKLTLAIVISSFVSLPAVGQICPYPFDGMNMPRCTTELTNNYIDIVNKPCVLCRPFVGACSMGGYNCVYSCNDCTDAAGGLWPNGARWHQDPIYNCATSNHPDSEDLCALCRAYPPAIQAVACTPYHCGDMNARDCKFLDCWQCW